MYPILGAVLGGAVGGPVGVVAGLKLGGAAAVGGGILGKFFSLCLLFHSQIYWIMVLQWIECPTFFNPFAMG